MKEDEDRPSDESKVPKSLPVVRLQSIERRQHLRLSPESLTGLLFIGNNQQVVMVRDISLEGARILNVPLDLKEGDLFELRATLDGGDLLSVRCSVVYAHGEEAWRTLGVRFIDIDRAEAERLLSYLSILGMKSLRWRDAV